MAYYYDNINKLWVAKFSELDSLINDEFYAHKEKYHKAHIYLKVTNLSQNDITNTNYNWDDIEKYHPLSYKLQQRNEGLFFPYYHLINDESCYFVDVTSFYEAFRGNGNLAEFQGYPKNIKNYNYAFYNCEKLTKVQKLPKYAYSDKTFENTSLGKRYFADFDRDFSINTYRYDPDTIDYYFINDDVDFNAHKLTAYAKSKIGHLYFNKESTRQRFITDGLGSAFSVSEKAEIIAKTAINPYTNKFVNVRTKEGTERVELTADRDDLLTVINEVSICDKDTVTVDLSHKNEVQILKTCLEYIFKQMKTIAYSCVLKQNTGISISNPVRISDNSLRLTVTFDSNIVKEDKYGIIKQGDLKCTVYDENNGNGIPVYSYETNYQCYSNNTLTVEMMFYSNEILPESLSVGEGTENELTISTECGYVLNRIESYLELFSNFDSPIYGDVGICEYEINCVYETDLTVKRGYKGDTLSREFNGVPYYAQPVQETVKFLNEARGGHALRVLKDKNKDSILISRYIGEAESPFVKPHSVLMTITSATSSEFTVPKENFPNGGVIILYGGAGGSVTNGGRGGYGQIKRINIPANPTSDILISQISFPKDASDGSRGSYTHTYYYETTSNGYKFCYRDSSKDTQYGSSGGIGGKSAKIKVTVANKVKEVCAYGGGGGGGSSGYWKGYTESAGDNAHGYGYCYDWREYYFSAGKGGNATSLGSANSSNGGTMVKFAKLDEYNTSTSAYVVIGAY